VCIYVFHQMYKLEADLHGCFAKLAIANAYDCVRVCMCSTEMYRLEADLHGCARHSLQLLMRMIVCVCACAPQGVWSLRQTSMDVHDKYLVLSFVGETRLLAINQV